MPDLAEIRSGLKNVIQNHVATPITAYDDATTVTSLPAVVIIPANGVYTGDMAQSQNEWWISLFVLCDANDMESGQKQLDAYLSTKGPDGIPKIIYDHGDLGYQDTGSLAVSMHAYGGSFQSNELQMVGAILRVHVVTNGSL